MDCSARRPARATLAAVLVVTMCAVAACRFGDSGTRPFVAGKMIRLGGTRSRVAAGRSTFWSACRRLADPGATETAIGDQPEKLLSARLPALGTPVTHWRPTGSLPPRAARGVRVVVVLTPHPDDETLSMGVLISRWHRAGDRVILVALTDGERSGGWLRIDRLLDVPPVPPALVVPGMPEVTLSLIARSRVAEMREAALAWGIAPQDVYLAHLDDARSTAGKRVTVFEVLAIVRGFAARYPDATFATMSFLAERQPEHLAAGEALCAAVRAHLIRHAVWAVSRLYWRFPGPRTCVVADAADRASLGRATAAYRRWDPAAGRYAVGYLSVGGQFDALRADPRACAVTSTRTPLVPAAPEKVWRTP